MLSVTILLAVVLLSEPACGKQQQMLTTGPSSWNNVGDPPPSIQLDPELRRALLRALTQLENEANHQAAAEQFTSNRTEDQIDDVQENLKHDLKRLIASFHVEDTYGNDQKIEAHDDAVEDQRTSDVEDRYREDISEKYQEDFSEVKYPSQENYQQVTDYLTGREFNNPGPSTTSEMSSELITPSPTDELTHAAIFYKNPEPEDQDKMTKLTFNDSHSDVDVVASSAEIQNMRDILPPEKPASSSDILVTPTASSGVTKSAAAEGDVSIFQAPLVAAFTLHQDESGLPTSVIPLLPPQPTAPTLASRDQQQLLLLREQELLHKTRLLEHQLAQFQEQRRQQQLYLEQQNRQAFLSQQQQFVPAVGTSRRPQRQETGTGIVDFQPSIEFPLSQPSAARHQVHVPQNSGNFFYQQSSGFLSVSPLQQENGLVPPPPPLPLQQTPSFGQPQGPSAVSQLQNLLYRAGVPDTPQQDLSIVSKVLSLNHLRRQDDTKSQPSGSP